MAAEGNFAWSPPKAKRQSLAGRPCSPGKKGTGRKLRLVGFKSITWFCFSDWTGPSPACCCYSGHCGSTREHAGGTANWLWNWPGFKFESHHSLCVLGCYFASSLTEFLAGNGLKVIIRICGLVLTSCHGKVVLLNNPGFTRPLQRQCREVGLNFLPIGLLSL